MVVFRSSLLPRNGGGRAASIECVTQHHVAPGRVPYDAPAVSDLVSRETRSLLREKKYRIVTRWRDRVDVAIKVGGIFVVATLGWILLPPLVAYPALVGYFVWIVWAIRDFSRRTAAVQALHGDASALMKSGDAAGAARILDSLCETSRFNPLWHATVITHLAATQVVGGRLEQAASLFSQAIKSGWLDPDGSFSSVYLDATLGLASVQVLQGDVEAGRQWLQRARTVTGTTARCRATLSESLLRCRAGEFLPAARLLDSEWTSVMDHLSAQERRVALAVALFSLQRSGADSYRGELANLRPEVIREQLRAAHRPGTLRHLGVEWPEMKEFLTREFPDGA